jgi:hypothetical protein
MPPRHRPVPRGVNSSTYCVRQRKKTGNSGGHVIEFKVKGQSRYRLSSTCTECGAKKCTFLKSGSHPPQTVSGGRIKSTESRGRKSPGSEYTVGGKIPWLEKVKGEAPYLIGQNKALQASPPFLTPPKTLKEMGEAYRKNGHPKLKNTYVALGKGFSPFTAVVGSIGPRWPGDFPNHVWTAFDVKKWGPGRGPVGHIASLPKIRR